MSKQQIYTPNPTNPFSEYRQGERLVIRKGNRNWNAVVVGFPKTSRFDTDHRMVLEPAVKGEWFGQMTISAENNWYGQHHISEVEIQRYETIHRQ